LILGFFFGGLKWWEKNKNKLPKPEERKIRYGQVIGLAILQLFLPWPALSEPKFLITSKTGTRFIQDPIGNLLSPSGLTFYGGLIFAIAALWYYCRKKNISFIKLADATSPSLMLAYGIGRMGCQVAGDGDWGIY
jgi:hypothetical protein